MNFREIFAPIGGNIHIATKISPHFNLKLLTNMDAYDSSEISRFLDGELYFRTKDSIAHPFDPRKYRIFRISMGEFDKKPMLMMDSNHSQFERYFFKRSEILHIPIKVGKKYSYGDFETEEIIDICLVMPGTMKWEDIKNLKLKEADLVKEFYHPS